MGYRAHTVTQHREYGSSVFYDFTQFEDYFYKMKDMYPDDELYQSEGQDYFEISKEVVEKEIKRLTELGLNEVFEFQSTHTGKYKEKNQVIVDSLNEALSESPEDSNYVTLEWY